MHLNVSTAERMSAGTTPTGDSTSQRSQPRKILVVDEAGTSQRHIATILRRAGMQVVPAFSDQEVQDALREHHDIDVAVFDPHPSDRSGKTLRRLHDEAGLPVVAVIASHAEASHASAETFYASFTAADHDRDFSGAVSRDADPEVVLHTVRTALRLHHAEHRRAAQEAQYNSLVESIEDFIVIHDPQGTIVYANEACEAMTGVRRDNLVGRSVNDLFHGDYLVRSQILAGQTGRDPGRSFSLQTEVVRDDATPVSVEVRSSPVIEHNAYTGELIVARDVSDEQMQRARLEYLNGMLLSVREVHKVIVRAESPEELIRETCRVLVRSGAYRNAWIMLSPWQMDPHRHTASDGFIGSGAELDTLTGGTVPPCGSPERLQNGGFSTCGRPYQECMTCPLHGIYADHAVMTVRLTYQRQNFGVMSVAIDGRFHQDDDSEQVFKELADDISYALFSRREKLRRDRAEREAAGYERRLQIYLERSPVGILNLDSSGRLLATNAHFRTWTGYTDAALIGRELTQVLWSVPASIREFFEDSGTKDTLTQRTMAAFKRSDEKTVWGDVVMFRFRADNNEAPVTIAIVVDATERKLAESRLNRAKRRLQQSEQRYRSLFEESADMVFFATQQGQILDINHAGAAMLGFSSPDEIVGKNAADFYFDPSARAEFVTEIQRHGFVKNFELVLMRKDGRKVFGSESATIVKEEDSNQPIYHGVIQDITERIEAEQRAMQRSLELSRANKELKAAHQELIKKEKLASIGQLSAGIAHEINNPLGFVRSNFAALRRYMDKYASFFQTVLTEQQHQTLNEALTRELNRLRIEEILSDTDDLFDETSDGIQRITAIVSNLKDFSRAGDNEVVDAYDINAGVKSGLVIAKNEYKYVATIHEDLRDVPPLRCNANEINQVILNLLVNASQALREAHTENGRIKITTWSDDTWVCCRITDNGPGIPPEHRSKVFEPFFTTKKAGEGTGLGLSISYDIIVNRHGGTMELASKPGHGTAFSIKLPRRNPDAP